MIIMKFGGTSVKDAPIMKKVIGIVKARQKDSPVVVLSACSSITDRLANLVTNATKSSEKISAKHLQIIEKYHLDLIAELIKNDDLVQKARQIIKFYIDDLGRLIEGIRLLKECTPRSAAQALAYGELLSTSIFDFACRDNGIDSLFVDARKLVKTDSEFLEGKVNFKEVRKNISKIKSKSQKGKLVITQGFIASDSENRTTVLGRGGSDYSAAIIGAALKAKEIQIWTDVSGVLTTDPKLVEKPSTIPVMTFDEIRELSFFGAKVLHPDTIKPAIENNIPVRILNTYKDDEKGTLILKEQKSDTPEIRSVVLKQNCNDIIINVPANENSHELFTLVLALFVKNKVKIMYSLCTENNCRIITDQKNDEKSIKKLLTAYNYKLEKVSMLGVCGTKLNLDKKDINISGLLSLLAVLHPKQLIHGASSVSILALFSQKAGLDALKKTHDFIVAGK